MRGKRIGLMLGIMLIGWIFVAGRADAALLGFDIFLPDILSNSTGTYSYNAGTDLFTSTAVPLIITFDGVTIKNITGPRSYNVSFYVDAAGNFAGGVAGDDFVISGNIDVDGNGVNDYTGDLIRGEVTEFGWFDTGTSFDLFDFTFDFTGGALSPFYASSSYKGGNQMTSGRSNFGGSFSTNFSGSQVKHDTAPVPEPASLLLLGSGLLGFTLFGRAKRKKISA